MRSRAYTLLSPGLIGADTHITFHDQSRGKLRDFRLIASKASLLVVSDAPISSVAEDLFDIAVHAYAADKLATSGGDENVLICMNLGLRNPLFYQSLKAEIECLLHWLTDAFWDLEFTEITARSQSEQVMLPFNGPSWTDASQVVLWSGGLDSMAGLGASLVGREGPSSVVTCAIDLGNNMRGLQRSTASAITRINRRHFPLSVRVRIEYPEDITDAAKNHRLRSRGFLFPILGSIAAHRVGCNKLLIYENGIGAINLPYLSHKQTNDHSRAVHPATLRRVEQLASKALGSVTIANPYIFSTKGEMCAALPSSIAASLAARSNSCDSRPRLPGVSSCGICSSCILRRIALHAAGVPDVTVYGKDPGHVDSHFGAIGAQVAHLSKCISQPNPWGGLVREFPELITARDALADNHGFDEALLVDLYRKFTTEWVNGAEHLLNSMRSK